MPEQIFEEGPLPAPVIYTVPGAGEVIPLDCYAEYDGSGAGGDYVPTLIYRSPSGHVIAQATLDSTVAAGDDAAVSWFRDVKHAAGVAPAGDPVHLAVLTLSQQNFGDTPITIPNNTVTDVTFPHANVMLGSVFTPTPGAGPFTALELESEDYIYVAHSSVRWSLAGFAQYSSIIGPTQQLVGGFPSGTLDNHGETPANTFTAGDPFSASPLWGVDTKTFVVPSAPTNMTLQVFQTSGVSKNVAEANLVVLAFNMFA